MTTETINTSAGHSVFQNRLTAYSTLAVAGACAVAAAPNSAKADIVYSGPLNLSVPVSAAGVYINLSTFSTYASLSAAQAAGGATAPILNIWGTSNTYAYLYPSTSTVNRFVGSAAMPTELAAGATIDATSGYTTSRSPVLTGNGWTAGTTGYLGVRFLNGTTTEYGWAQITAQAPPTTANPTKILGIAYDNTGAGIVAGAVPEPGTVAFLAAGAIGAGSLAWRRRKAA